MCCPEEPMIEEMTPNLMSDEDMVEFSDEEYDEEVESNALRLADCILQTIIITILKIDNILLQLEILKNDTFSLPKSISDNREDIESKSNLKDIVEELAELETKFENSSIQFKGICDQRRTYLLQQKHKIENQINDGFQYILIHLINQFMDEWEESFLPQTNSFEEFKKSLQQIEDNRDKLWSQFQIYEEVSGVDVKHSENLFIHNSI